MSSRKLKVESVTRDESGLGSRVLIAFNRDLNQMEIQGLELMVKSIIESANQK